MTEHTQASKPALFKVWIHYCTLSKKKRRGVVALNICKSFYRRLMPVKSICLTLKSLSTCKCVKIFLFNSSTVSAECDIILWFWINHTLLQQSALIRHNSYVKIVHVALSHEGEDVLGLPVKWICYAATYLLTGKQRGPLGWPLYLQSSWPSPPCLYDPSLGSWCQSSQTLLEVSECWPLQNSHKQADKEILRINIV